MSGLPAALGVAGAGTMGAGIAQLGCQAGIRTLLYDPLPEARERGEEYVRRGLAKMAERGRLERDPAELEVVDDLDALARCELIVEAAPERPELKRDLFRELSERKPGAILATNTSSILVTSLASAAARPENVVGMHFFNPPPLMPLLEVIPAAQSSEDVVATAVAVGEAMGKRVIRAYDGPGFLVNRCNRPFGAEALKLLQERVATHEQIDRIVRLGGGFRMGPFELMDLVGIDVGFEVAKSFTEQSFGEPRWKPSPLQARMVAAGRLGRKTGGGWYPGDHRPEDEAPLEPGGGDGRPVAIDGSDELRERAAKAGFDVREDAELVVVSCANRTLRSYGRSDAIGFNLLPGAQLVELTGPRSEEAERFFTALGLHHEWVGDAPGLVLGRIVCQLVNEACFAVGEGIGSEADVDAGLELGMSHPRGPFAWGAAIGFDRVLRTIDGLWEERREERYRAAPLLRSRV